MAFYHRLTRYADRMVRPPDRYTFKKHYIMRLPKRIFDHLVNKDVTPEYSKMETILHHARRAEEVALQTSRYWDKQRTIKAARGAAGENAMRRPYGNKEYQKPVERQDNRRTTTEKSGQRKEPYQKVWNRSAQPTRQEWSASKTKDPDKKTGYDRRNVSSGAKKCFSCGEFGHMAKDNKCPLDKKGKGTSTQMYAAREVVQEDDEEGEPSEDREEPLFEDEEDGEPYEGSQYSSEGEEVEFELDDIGLQEEDDDDDRRGVQMHALQTGMEDYWQSDEEDLDDANSWELEETEDLSSEEEGLPLLVEVSDSDEDVASDDDTIEEGDSEGDSTESPDADGQDEVVYESRVLIAALRTGEVTPPPKEKKVADKKTSTTVRKSSKILDRPVRLKDEAKGFIMMVKLNGQAVVALLDSGCTMDAVSPELVRVADLKVHELAEQVPMQLGTRGSQAKINYGTKACIKYGHVDMQHYFDIVNIDRYDVILGMVFMRKHGIVLDFDKNEIRHKKEILPALRENPDAYLLVCRQAMRY